MLLRQLKFGEPINYELKLKKNNKETIGILEGSTVTNLEVKLEDIWTLDFTVSYYISDTLTHQRIKNPLYDLVTQEKKIILNDEVEFVIRELSENGKTKVCKAYSSEIKLSKRKAVFSNITRQLKSDKVNTSVGLFDEFNEAMTHFKWKLGYLDPEAKVDHINNGTSNKYRFFDSVNKGWLPFIREDIAKSYDVLPIFNTVTKTVDIYDNKTYGRKTGFKLSKDNYINDLKRNTRSNDVITVLKGYGVDQESKSSLPLNSVNPLGDFVENFDYYRVDMSEELNTALDIYYAELDILFAQWISKNTELLDIQQQQTLKSSQLKTKSEERKTLDNLKAGYIASGDNVQLTRIKAEIVVKEQEIANVLSTIESLNKQTKAKMDELTALTISMQKDKIKKNGVLIFNEDLLEELEEFISEGEVSNEAFFTAYALYDWTKKQSEMMSKPTIEFDIEVNSFIDAIGSHIESDDDMILGDYIVIEDDRLGEQESRFVGYVHSPQSKSLKLTFTNKEQIEDIAKAYSDGIKQSNNTKNFLDSKKWSWYEAQNQADWIKEFRLEGLNAAQQQVISMQGRNRINIDENGIWLYDTQDPNAVLAMVAGLIVISDDGLQTVKTAIDKNGLIAEQIVGKIILGENLFIGDANGLIEINGNGMTVKAPDGKIRVRLGVYNGLAGLTIYDKEGKEVVLSEDGIVQRFQYAVADNLDDANAIIMPLKFDNGVKSIRTVELSLKLEEFRGYTKGASAGGGVTTSSSGGGLRTSSDGGGVRTTVSGGGLVTSNAAKWDDYNDASSLLYLTENTPAGEGVYIQYKNFRHTHSVNTAHTHAVDTSHSHTVDTNHSHAVDTAHSHNIIHGIYKGARASNVKVYVNNVLVISGINADITLNIEDKLKVGNNEIKITSDTLGRINATVNCKVFASF